MNCNRNNNYIKVNKILNKNLITPNLKTNFMIKNKDLTLNNLKKSK